MTPKSLVIGQPDGSLLQVVYPKAEILSGAAGDNPCGPVLVQVQVGVVASAPIWTGGSSPNLQDSLSLLIDANMLCTFWGGCITGS